MNSKRIGIALAILVASGLTACEPSPEVDPTSETEVPETTTKDVYKTLDECMQDWGDKEMCTQAATAQAQVNQAQAQAAANQSNGGGGGVVPVFIPMFYGPEYTAGERKVVYRDRIVSAKSNHAFKTTPRLKPSTGFLTSRNTFAQKYPGQFAKAMPRSNSFTPASRAARVQAAAARSAARSSGFSSGSRSTSRGSFGSTGRSFGGFSGG